MKKLLSVVLALAIVASSLIVFGAMATAAPAEVKAVKLDVTKATTTASNGLMVKVPFLTATDFGDKETIDVTFAVTNPFDQEVSIEVKACEWDSWRENVYVEKDTASTRVAFGSVETVEANGVGLITLTFAKTGYFYHNGLNPKFSDGNYLDKLALRINYNGMVVAEGASVEIAVKDNDALNEKFVNAAEGLAWNTVKTTTATKLDATTMSAALKNALTATPTPTPSATPVVDKAVVNGDVEDGKTNWGVWNGGTTTVVADPDNANNHVAYFVPTGQYHSVGFDLGPAIIQDEANGYKGEGAGTYIITFKAKADAGKGGKFAVGISAQAHTAKDTVVGSYTTTVDSWISGTTVELTDSWETYTSTVKVSEQYLDNVCEIYKTGLKAKIYQLSFRFDGANLAYKDKQYFGYYVDDVKIEKQTEATPTPTAGADGTVAPGATATPTPTPAPTPNAIEVHAVQDTLYYLISDKGIMDADDIKNGVLKKEITFENVGENDFSVRLGIQATVKKSDGSATWAGFANEDGFVEIAAGEKETITIEVEFENGVTSILDQDVTVDQLFFRLDFNNQQALNEGDGVLFYGDDDIVKGFATKTSSDKLTYATKVLNIKGSTSNTGDALPVALIATLAVATVALVVVVAKKRKEN